MRSLWRRLVAALKGPAGEPTAFTQVTGRVNETTWATARLDVQRSGRTVSYRLQVPVPHTEEVRVERHTKCFSIEILRSGTDLDAAARTDVLRRAMPIIWDLPNGPPQLAFEGDDLHIVFAGEDSASPNSAAMGSSGAIRSLLRCDPRKAERVQWETAIY